MRIADLGVGSGAILVALLTELPHAHRVSGTDRDPAALAVARENARRLGIAARAFFVACDFGAALARQAADLVVDQSALRCLRDDIATLDSEGARLRSARGA